MNRKRFIKKFGQSVFLLPIIPASFSFTKNENEDHSEELNFSVKQPIVNSNNNQNPANPADEGFWLTIGKQFNRTPGMINLENGYFSHQPKSVIKAHQEFEQYINTQTSWFMRKEQQKAIEDARIAFASFQQIAPEELAFTRNTTESLNIIIGGFPWKSGDEVIIGNHDYGSMVEAFQQAEKRWGISVKVAKVPEKPKNVQEMIESYTQLISNKTQMVHITDLINLHGQVLPTYQIIESIKKQNPNIFVAVDAAHSVAHTLDSIGTLMEVADAVGGSLHKWMCNPIGLGFLTVKKSQIDKFWPLMGDTGMAPTNIRKFEHQGTRPIHSIQTLPIAIEFHQKIGSVAKLQRLQYLKSVWMGNPDTNSNPVIIPDNWTGIQKQIKPLTSFPNIRIYGEGVWQPTIPGGNPLFGSGAIATVAIDGYSPVQLADKLFKEYKIFSVAIDHPEVKGIRITPHLSSTFKDCAMLNIALQNIAENKK